MSEYQFYEGKLPSAYRYNFEQYLFNREEYRLLQSAAHWISFYILNEKDLVVDGHFHVYVKGDTAKSIIQSPFGGIEFSDRVDNKTAFNFIEFCSSELKDQRIATLTVVNPPQVYNTDRQALIETFLLNNGFAISNAELSSVINVTTRPFSEILHPRKRRKLNQTLPFGLQFERLSASALNAVYDFIAEHRAVKNYVLSVSLDHLRNSMERLPGAYMIFGVYDKDRLVAASVAVLISKDILYHFISDHDRKLGEAKPALVLMLGIYNFCQANNIRLLDLGTSVKESQPNFKLIKFKTEIGGQLTNKFTFTKKLS